MYIIYFKNKIRNILCIMGIQINLILNLLTILKLNNMYDNLLKINLFY